MAKVKNFQVVIEVENGVTIFDSTNSKKEVQEWIDAYTANGQAKSVTVYERNEKIGAYEIVVRKSSKTAQIVKFADKNYYEVLKAKMWSQIMTSFKFDFEIKKIFLRVRRIFFVVIWKKF